MSTGCSVKLAVTKEAELSEGSTHGLSGFLSLFISIRHKKVVHFILMP